MEEQVSKLHPCPVCQSKNVFWFETWDKGMTSSTLHCWDCGYHKPPGESTGVNTTASSRIEVRYAQQSE